MASVATFFPNPESISNVIPPFVPHQSSEIETRNSMSHYIQDRIIKFKLNFPTQRPLPQCTLDTSAPTSLKLPSFHGTTLSSAVPSVVLCAPTSWIIFYEPSPVFSSAPPSTACSQVSMNICLYKMSET